MIQELVWLGDIPVATIRTDQGGTGAGVFYIHTDHLNAPTKVTRPTDNQVIWRWDHDPYGNGTPNQDPDGNGLLLTMNLRFPGQYADQETGLNYNMARDYDPATGRYVESDPIGLDGESMSTYAYVRDNPINMVDEDGLLGHAPGKSTGPSAPNGNPYPGFSPQDGVCTVGGPIGQLMNSSSCVTGCCKAHDECYAKNKCNASSWLGNIFGYRKACQQCNRAAESCIAKATTQGCSTCGK